MRPVINGIFYTHLFGPTMFRAKYRSIEQLYSIFFFHHILQFHRLLLVSRVVKDKESPQVESFLFSFILYLFLSSSSSSSSSHSLLDRYELRRSCTPCSESCPLTGSLRVSRLGTCGRVDSSDQPDHIQTKPTGLKQFENSRVFHSVVRILR